MSRLVDSIVSSCGVPILFESHSSSLNSPTRFSELLFNVGFGSLYLFQSAAGWRLSEDIYAGLHL